MEVLIYKVLIRSQIFHILSNVVYIFNISQRIIYISIDFLVFTINVHTLEHIICDKNILNKKYEKLKIWLFKMRRIELKLFLEWKRTLCFN